MTPTTPRTLTWGTIAAAVISAVLLAALDASLPETKGGATQRAKMALPTDTLGAGERRESPPSVRRDHDAAGTAGRR